MRKSVAVMMFAAAAAVSAAPALAQNMNLKAEVPFAFHAGSSVLPAGTYRIMQESGATSGVIYTLKNLASEKSILVVANSRVYSKGGAVKPPQMVFQCGREECALSEIWGGFTDNGVHFRHHLTGREKEYQQVAIVLTSGSAQ